MELPTNKCLAIYIVKPEAFHRKDEIRDFIENNSDIEILKLETVVLNKEDIENIYIDDQDTLLYGAITKHLNKKPVELALVTLRTEPKSLNRLVRELSRICGEHFVPAKCRKGTVRREFGIDKSVYYDEQEYQLNGIHKVSLNECSRATDWCLENIFKK